jgi:tetratricopeptide (TPR) repeat protein
MEKAVALAPKAADYRYNFGRVLAAKGDLPTAVVQFEEAAKLSAMQEPVILEMLAATYSDTGRYAEAVSTARQALELAIRQRNDALATRLKTSLTRYEGLARSGTAPTATP